MTRSFAFQAIDLYVLGCDWFIWSNAMTLEKKRYSETTSLPRVRKPAFINQLGGIKIENKKSHSAAKFWKPRQGNHEKEPGNPIDCFLTHVRRGCMCPETTFKLNDKSSWFVSLITWHGMWVEAWKPFNCLVNSWGFFSKNEDGKPFYCQRFRHVTKVTR